MLRDLGWLGRLLPLQATGLPPTYTNSQWVKQLELEKFRCPLCTREFFPWKESANRMLVNKVLVTSPNGDQELATELQMGM